MRTMDQYRAMVEKALPEMLPPALGYGGAAIRAARYSLLAGGKRIRPSLTLAACELVGGDASEALNAACALECIHAYSLIHDDLPALDNDDMRRGRPSCHARYGEAVAILAGDGLNTHAFWLIAQGALRAGANAERHMRALSHIAAAAGFHGMVSGQSADICLEKADWGEAALGYVHVNKTAAMFRAAVLAGAEIGGVDQADLDAFSEYALRLGLAFQAADDVLDVTSTPEELGKTPGKDAIEDKMTVVSLYGIEQAQRRVRQESRVAAEIARTLPGDSEIFVELANSLAERTR